MYEVVLHRFLWLWFPLGACVSFLMFESFIPNHVLEVMFSENGLIELLEFSVIFPAFVIAAISLSKIKIADMPYIAAWLGLAVLGCFYVAGEEVSWGQHFLGWGTPENWASLNDQNETNLHNTSSWFDQKPRILLEVCVVIGGLLIPLVKKYKPSLLPIRFEMIYPPAILSVTAGTYLVLKLIDGLSEIGDFRFFTRASEIQEFYVYYFVLLYVWVLKQRLTA